MGSDKIVGQFRSAADGIAAHLRAIGYSETEIEDRLTALYERVISPEMTSETEAADTERKDLERSCATVRQNLEDLAKMLDCPAEADETPDLSALPLRIYKKTLNDRTKAISRLFFNRFFHIAEIAVEISTLMSKLGYTPGSEIAESALNPIVKAHLPHIDTETLTQYRRRISDPSVVAADIIAEIRAAHPQLLVTSAYVAELSQELDQMYRRLESAAATVHALCTSVAAVATELDAGTDETLKPLIASVGALSHIEAAAHNADAVLDGPLGLSSETIRKLDELETALETERTKRIDRIYAVKAEIETLWHKLSESELTIRQFDAQTSAPHYETHPYSARLLRIYESELQRLTEKKKQHMEVFITDLRAEINDLWTEMYFSEPQKAQFSGMRTQISPEIAETLLEQHEAYAAELREQREAMTPVLTLLAEYTELSEAARALEESMKDSSRLLSRSAKSRSHPSRLLEEEHMRKRIMKRGPRVTAELQQAVAAWEAGQATELWVAGGRLAETLEDPSLRFRRRSPVKSVVRSISNPTAASGGAARNPGVAQRSVSSTSATGRPTSAVRRPHVVPCTPMDNILRSYPIEETPVRSATCQFRAEPELGAVGRTTGIRGVTNSRIGRPGGMSSGIPNGIPNGVPTAVRPGSPARQRAPLSVTKRTANPSTAPQAVSSVPTASSVTGGSPRKLGEHLLPVSASRVAKPELRPVKPPTSSAADLESKYRLWRESRLQHLGKENVAGREDGWDSDTF